MGKKLEIKVALQILKPVSTVFEAIIDPAEMSNYFISEGSGMMVEGETLTWKFSELDMEFPVYVKKIEQDRYISYRWEVEGEILLVEMTLEPYGDDSTVVTITEWLVGNTGGWSNFLASLKAYLEYGINLRKGSFNFMVK
jgi:uncharacterized protein YndB with AHSA1/START domain